MTAVKMKTVVMTSKQRSKSNVIVDACITIFAILFILAIIVPFWTQLMESFSKDNTTLGFKLLPSGFTLEAYKQVFSQNNVISAYINTIVRTLFGTLLCVIVTYGAAYTLSKRNIPFNRVLTLFIVMTMFFGGGLIPEYLQIQKLGLIDNRLSLILPFVVNGYFIMLTRNFIYSIPEALEESAFLDGANELVIAFRIFLPISKPIIATIALWSAVYYWNEWFTAMIWIQTPAKQVMQVLLRRILIEAQLSAMFDNPDNILSQTPEAVQAATMFIAIVPILASYPFAQKYFIQGLTTGAVKG